MDRTSSLRVAVACTRSTLRVVTALGTAAAQASPTPVHESKVVPSLSPTCRHWRALKVRRRSSICGWRAGTASCSLSRGVPSTLGGCDANR